MKGVVLSSISFGESISMTGAAATWGLEKRNICKKAQRQRKFLDLVKCQRKVLRARKKGYQDKNEEKERTVYASASF